MESSELSQLARRLLDGDLSQQDFLDTLAPTLSATLTSSTLDLDRQRRCGFPEVIFGEGKSVEALIEIVEQLKQRQVSVLATRISPQHAAALAERFADGEYHAMARTWQLPNGRTPTVQGRVAVVTAGTSDQPVAEEARQTLDWMGVSVDWMPDVGVAGPHRLAAQVERLRNVNAVVVVAGMEGALPSVVGGHVACPVIGVPTSVGYGANFAGVSALLSMLNSCAANVTVVNIDAGFKAGYVAGMIARQVKLSVD